ncbi:MAG: hypothetical protein ABIX46_10895, partial [Burkholderiaceae bacterium]
QTLAGPIVGAVSFTWLQDAVARNTDYWRALLGGVILLLVLVFPQGIAGFFGSLVDTWTQRRRAALAKAAGLRHEAPSNGSSHPPAKSADRTVSAR